MNQQVYGDCNVLLRSSSGSAANKTLSDCNNIVNPKTLTGFFIKWVPEGKYTDAKEFLSLGIMLLCQRIYGQNMVGSCIGTLWRKWIKPFWSLGLVSWGFFLCFFVLDGCSFCFIVVFLSVWGLFPPCSLFKGWVFTAIPKLGNSIDICHKLQGGIDASLFFSLCCGLCFLPGQ